MDIYKRLWKYVTPYTATLIFASGLMLLSALGDVLVSGVIYVTTNGLMNKEVVDLSGIPHIPKQLAISFSVGWIPLIVIGVFIFRGLVSYYSKYLMAVAGVKIVRDLRNDLYRHISHLSCDYFTKRHTGDLMSRIINDVQNIQSAITLIVIDVVKSPLTIIFTVPVVFVMGGKLAWFSVGIFPLVAIPIVVLGNRLRKLTKKLSERSADTISFLQETLIGIKVVKAFNAEEKENARFNEITNHLCDFACKTFRAIEIQRPLIEIMGAFGVGLAIYFALQTLSLDRFMTFVGSLFLLYEPAKKMSKVNVVVQQTIASGRRIFDIMDVQPSVVEVPHAHVFVEPIKKIAFENISFRYNEERQVLSGVSLEAKNGEAIALVGSSGSGKTTLVSLLPRFYDPQEGKITINGKDIKTFTLRSLRETIGIVSQETILFNGTIKENILYGKPGASDEEVIKAARAAYAHDFIMEIPTGYDTFIGERGLKLSGGQRQRLSIARAMLKNPPVLVFDEATSHLDTESEREVQKAIEALMQGRTVFVIAHRLSTIQNSDRIIVLDQGRIVQTGTHDELVQVKGQYKKLYELQFSS